ncbi:MAG: 5-(carboxyamino)imidazole ribonucleotide mutase [Spirochaetota bacterium]|nr:5-(carboxyamino)imidazole ribonucleotide mutase [Spirochaetota bacterium]
MILADTLVGILMGSDSDLSVMKEAALILEEFDVGYDITILSAHRTPELLTDYVQKANENFEVLIAGAGAAAHLPGVVAAHTTLPVIGVPLDATSLGGTDSLYAIVQMPGGIPVATMAIGKAGAKNAGLFAVQILAASRPELKKRMADYRKAMSQSVIKKADKLKSLGWKDYLNDK